MEPLLVAACSTAVISGSSLALFLTSAREESRRQRALRASMGPEMPAAEDIQCVGSAAHVIAAVRREGHAAHSVRFRKILKSPFLGIGLREAPVLLARAGLADVSGSEALRAVRLKAAVASAMAGTLVGLPFSSALSCLLGLAGLLAGYGCVPWALKREAAERNADMERHLSEMLEVVVLGLRSGLSFERAFRLYPRYFDSGLGRSMERAARQWDMGLLTREEALRQWEAEFDSPQLSRVVASMVRSLRFGTSVADALEASATEAREIHRARMEEKVAKVAVKMMLPVGALILPAMLLLVLGPVLLELAQGF